MRVVSLFILAVCLLISCDINKSKQETIDINDIVYDTLRVNVLIFGGDTLSATISIDEPDIED